MSLFALPVTVIALTGVANAYNMADGLDVEKALDTLKNSGLKVLRVNLDQPS